MRRGETEESVVRTDDFDVGETRMEGKGGKNIDLFQMFAMEIDAMEGAMGRNIGKGIEAWNWNKLTS